MTASNHSLSRRQWLGAAGAAAGVLTLSDLAAAEAPKGRIKQSLVEWCFKKYWNLEEMCQVARKLGCVSVEMVDPKDFPTLKKNGLICAMTPSHGCEEGMNNPKYQDMCLEKMRKAIDASAAAGFPNVITFTGYREGIPDDVGMKNCVAGYKKIIGYAEEKKVTLCLEVVNSRLAEEWKGHPGYQGDHTDYCVELVKQVGSPRMKVLFDLYHMQVMDGDLIAHIRKHAEYIGHVHNAGNPGRGEIDDKQEINYRPIMKALVEVGYKGIVGQEFIPTRDPLQGLKEAVATCDV